MWKCAKQNRRSEVTTEKNDVPLPTLSSREEVFSQVLEHDAPDPVNYVMGPECPSDSDTEGTLTDDAPEALPP